MNIKKAMGYIDTYCILVFGVPTGKLYKLSKRKRSAKHNEILKRANYFRRF